MPHNRVRPRRDKGVVVEDGELPGEEAAERTMAPDPDETACDGEDRARKGRSSDNWRARGGRWPQQRQDAIRDRGRVLLCDYNRDFRKGEPAEAELRGRSDETKDGMKREYLTLST